VGGIRGERRLPGTMEAELQLVPEALSTLPLYEYRCTQCGNRFEKIQNFSAVPETECPKCHGVLERPLNAPALQFKGAGWYINDYAPKAASGSSDSKPADSGAAASSDSKSASGDSAAKPSTSETASKPAATESAPKAAASSASSTSSTS
jgi:putative FmdB family regulatory protein